MAKFDLTKAFEQIGKLFARRLSLNIQQQRGVDGQPYSYPKKKTSIRRGIKKFSNILEPTKGGKKRTASGKYINLKRLWVTGNYARNAFLYRADNAGVIIGTSSDNHYTTMRVIGVAVHKEGRATYADITKYNSRNWQPNKNIDNPPLVFPKTKEEVQMMKPEMQQARQIIFNELKKQISTSGLIIARREMNIG